MGEIVNVKAKAQQLGGLLMGRKDQIANALGKAMDSEQFIRVAMTTITKGGPQLIGADSTSLVAAVMEAAQLGLMPNGATGEAYIVPVKHKGKQLAEMRIGYRGRMKLARRGGKVRAITAEVVYSNDCFEVDLGTARRIVHRPWYLIGGCTEPGEFVCAYACASIDGESQFEIVSAAKIYEARSRSDNPHDATTWSNVWKLHFDAMARKTAIARLCKLLPLPDALAEIFARDDDREGARAFVDVSAYEPKRPTELEDLIGPPPDEPGDSEPVEGGAA